jgi:hypothetical protein
MSLSNQLKDLLKKCPLGWYENRLIRTRSTTDDDVIKWLKELHDLIQDSHKLSEKAKQAEREQI